ncbi:MAG: hypothetical protein U5J63_01710 [Fodinibius sp.]|nr:hypothetical protein [Fodinibius sp.]
MQRANVVTSLDSSLQTIFARNYYNNEFAGRVAASAIYSPTDFELDAFSGDRSAFIGRNNTLASPNALRKDQQLDHRFGVGREACAASQLVINLASGASIDVYMLLAETEDEDTARKLIQKYRNQSTIEESLQQVRRLLGN